jgi:peptide/nickel transport system substrate-binding protein
MLLFWTLGWAGLTAADVQDLLVNKAQPGRPGGRIVISYRVEPRTLNPVAALDVTSREIISLLNSDLIDVDHSTLQPVPGLAKKWTASKDRRRFTLNLRHGVKFSDGHPFTADDVVFTFAVHLDENVRSSQRELLVFGGAPIAVRKLESHTVVLESARPHPAAERVFDSIGILPKHLLEKPWREGRLAKAWGVSTASTEMAGLGPFRMREYVHGERLVLERNPHYWKVDSRGAQLPYLNEIVILFVGSEEAQVMRFQSGETHIVEGLRPENYAVVQQYEQKRGFRLHDLGPGLEYSFLLLNLNNLSSADQLPIRQKQEWFQQHAFRQAISAAIDRDAIVRLVYRGMGSPIWTHVTDGNKTWKNANIAKPPRDLTRAKQLLQSAGFSWNAGGKLVDAAKREIGFSILTSAGNTQRSQIATIIQDDLKQIGITASVVSLEFRAMLDRVFKSYEYEAAVMTLASGDTDPNSEMNVLALEGSTHLWNLNSAPAQNWEKEIDVLMRRQQTTIDPKERKRQYDRVQELVAIHLPLICVVSPHVLVGASERIGNLRPSIIRPYILWNADELFLQ